MLTSVDRLLFVRGVPIFKELRDDFLVRLASIMDELSFPTNYTIFTEGQEGRSLYIVVSGRVSVHLKQQELAQLDQGTCFGEMSLFDAEPRSASVTTLEPCECLILTQQQLYEAVDETPGIAVNIIRMLSRRIRELNKELNDKKQDLSRYQAASDYTPPLLEQTDLQLSHPGSKNGLSVATAEEVYQPGVSYFNGNLPY
ncbi:MAG: Crp/Fnr family transcriptional regulator [Leptolyngbya sp. SIO4C5]|uniref:Crp/Fnr family transcriptional regulator n=1 Tax=Sphaerothrix gracilis TaxID=3151835 RepID=UPI0013BFDFE6|nr:Crp/Fnr family transcriptional regulator [Leptolyngbya sp. SIO4C5]